MANKVPYYMTEDQFLTLITDAYRSRIGGCSHRSEPGHPADHASNFSAFVDAFYSASEAICTFVAAEIRKEEPK